MDVECMACDGKCQMKYEGGVATNVQLEDLFFLS